MRFAVCLCVSAPEQALTASYGPMPGMGPKVSAGGRSIRPVSGSLTCQPVG